jgi:hypothetical protein
MKKAAPFILLIVFAIAIIARIYKQTNPSSSKARVTNTDPKDPAGYVDRHQEFDRRISYIGYSNHARCRMECRHITESEVKDIMQEGRINYDKSDLQNARCPRYALEGRTHDDQRVRIVFAQCDESTTVVTVIDLDTEWPCHCPGDDGSAGSAQKNGN